jgi:hypothetical protein
MAFTTGQRSSFTTRYDRSSTGRFTTVSNTLGIL